MDSTALQITTTLPVMKPSKLRTEGIISLALAFTTLVPSKDIPDNGSLGDLVDMTDEAIDSSGSPSNNSGRRFVRDLADLRSKSDMDSMVFSESPESLFEDFDCGIQSAKRYSGLAMSPLPWASGVDDADFLQADFYQESLGMDSSFLIPEDKPPTSYRAFTEEDSDPLSCNYESISFLLDNVHDSGGCWDDLMLEDVKPAWSEFIVTTPQPSLTEKDSGLTATPTSTSSNETHDLPSQAGDDRSQDTLCSYSEQHPSDSESADQPNSDIDPQQRLKNKTKRSRGRSSGVLSSINLSEEDIIAMPVTMFNDWVKALPIDLHKDVKDMRRRGKNKLAARNCRKRKQDCMDAIQGEVELMRNRRMLSESKLRQKQKEMGDLMEMLTFLQRFTESA